MKKLVMLLFVFVAPAFGQVVNYTYPVVPNKSLTPGETFPVSYLSQNIAKICAPGYTKTIRHVTYAERLEVFREYNIPYSLHRNYEVDHFISLCLGGDNSIKNLWPEPFHYKVNGIDLGARAKDKVEVYLYHQVRDKKLTIEEADQIISSNWVKYYLDVYLNHRGY